MVTEHFNFQKKTILIKKKKHKHVLVLDWKVICIYCSQFHNLHVNTTAIHKVNKIQYMQKGFVSGSLKIANCDGSNDCGVPFESIIRINAASWRAFIRGRRLLIFLL